MRKAAFLIILFLIGNGMALGQTNKADYGLKVGVGMANLQGDDVNNSEALLGFKGGVFARYQLTENLYLQPEILFVQKGASGDLTLSPDEYENIKIGYIQVPVLPEYNMDISSDISASIILGPAFSLKIHEDFNEVEGTNTLFKETSAQTQEFSVVGGLGLNVKKLKFDLRYDLGVTNALNRTNTRNSMLTFSIGYLF